MKILFSYPPLDATKGYPTLGQNRQFQYFTEPTLIYPVVPATAATMLRDAGHEVIWNDCVAECINREEYFQLIEEEKPDLIVFETKTPVVKEHWQLIDEIKLLPFTANHALGPEVRPPITDYQLPITVLIGDHVTALPEESMRNSQVDFVLTGGDYDFLLCDLCQALESGHLSSVNRQPSTVNSPLSTVNRQPSTANRQHSFPANRQHSLPVSGTAKMNK